MQCAQECLFVFYIHKHLKVQENTKFELLVLSTQSVNKSSNKQQKVNQRESSWSCVVVVVVGRLFIETLY